MTDALLDVAPGVLIATASRWSSVCTVLVSGPHCLIIDPGITAAEVSGIADALHRREVAAVAGFSTHPHWDHLLWSSRWPVPRWATPDAVTHAIDHDAEILAEAQAELSRHAPTLTDLTALVEAAIPWPGPQAVVVPYPGHCPGSAALLVADLGVLVLGDMLSDVEVPLLDLESADPITDYADSIAMLVQTAEAAQVTTVIPGHGTVCDVAGMRRRAEADLAYLDAVAAGREPDDPRLADPWVLSEHRRQEDHLSGTGR